MVTAHTRFSLSTLTASALLTLGLIAIAPQSADARPSWPNRVPNSNGQCSLCHLSSNGGGARTAFGNEVKSQGGPPIWSNLYNVDSDGDSYTNGQELCDPDGTWTIGDADPVCPMDFMVSDPSDADSIPEAPQPADMGGGGDDMGVEDMGSGGDDMGFMNDDMSGGGDDMDADMDAGNDDDMGSGVVDDTDMGTGGGAEGDMGGSGVVDTDMGTGGAEGDMGTAGGNEDGDGDGDGGDNGDEDDDGGCGGCAQGDANGAPLGGLAMLAALGFAKLSRRRRRRA